MEVELGGGFRITDRFLGHSDGTPPRACYGVPVLIDPEGGAWFAEELGEGCEVVIAVILEQGRPSQKVIDAFNAWAGRYVTIDVEEVVG